MTDADLNEIFDTSLSSPTSPLSEVTSIIKHVEKNVFKTPNIVKKNDPDSPKYLDQQLKLTKKYEETKYITNQKIISLKQANLTEEQTLESSNNLKFRNFVWDITLKHFGRGIYSDDLSEMFNKKIADEEYKLKKEVLDLQESQKEEYRNAKETNSSFPRYRRIYIGNVKPDPSEVAQKIFDILQGFVQSPEDFEIDRLIEQMLTKLRYNAATERREIISKIYQTNKKKERSFLSPLVYSPSITQSSKRYFSPRLPHGSPMRSDADIRRHIRERNKLKETIAQTDKFMKKMQSMAFGPEFYPHLSPRK